MIRFVAVDWGTSSLRVWAMAADGSVLAERKSGQGMSTLDPSGFAPVLDGHLHALSIPAEVPVLICGMASARTGWREVAYLDLPLRLDTVPEAAVQVDEERDIRILPGAAQRVPDAPDVMRGEETMLLGAVRQHGASGVVCMPGTHSKWATLQDGVLTRFETYMTGEVFNLFRQHSTLADFLSGTDFDETAFAAGLEAGLRQPEAVMCKVFDLRAGPLLGLVSENTIPSRLSGLLIGLEIAGARASAGTDVTLIASGPLADRYHRALTLAVLNPRLIDADDAVRAGLAHSAAAIWKTPYAMETAT
ncbi:2-dehydro-3-deoxygalactonokinase [Amaricoccus tamworthensis]|uniref:2-dehydro-3-deoxygalactonokinase n=1 Tax=Amaricoccus tamworthensis TaxID=57002 RepID=UPI003C7DA7D9